MSIEQFLQQKANEMTISQGSSAEQQARSQEMIEDYNRLVGSPLVDTSSLNSYNKSFAKVDTLTKNLSVMAEAGTGTALEFRWKDEKTGEWDPKLLTGSDMYGPNWKYASYDERRDMINDRKKGIINSYYGNTMESGISAAAGMVSGILTDPASLTPMGATYKGAAAIGAATAGTEAAVSGLAQKGEIDVEDVALATAVGVVAGPLLLYGGRSFMGFIRSKSTAREPVTVEEVKGQMDLFGIPDSERGNIQTIADDINKSLDIKEDPKSFAATKQVEKSFKGDTNSNLQYDMFDQRLEALRKSEVRISQADKEARAKKAMEMERMWSAHEKQDFAFPDELQVTKDINSYKKALERENKSIRYAIPDKSETAMASAMKKALKSKGQELDDFKAMARSQQGGFASLPIMRDIAASGIGATVGYAYDGEEGALFGAIAGLGIVHSSGLGAKLYNKVGKMLPSKGIKTDPAVEDITKNFMSGRFLSKPETAFKSWGRTGMEFAERFKRANEDLNATISKNMADLDKVFYKEGIKQKIFVFDKNSPEYKQIPAILNKTLNEADANPAAVAASKKVKQILNKTLYDAETSGLITNAKRMELLKDAETTGYFPRVYNEFYLNSGEGQKKWIEMFTGRDWTEKELVDAFVSMGDPKKATDTTVVAAEKSRKLASGSKQLQRAVLDGRIVKKDGGVYKMSPALAKKLHEARAEKVASTRSNHLQKERKILLPDDVLAPFLVNDTSTVISSYLRDSYKAIHLARYFGKNDSVAQRLFSDIERISPSHAKEMQEVFYTMAGNAEWSENIRKFTEMPLWMKRGYGSAMSFETLKLVFAPVVNSVQATVNGSTMLARVSQSAPQAMRAYSKGLKATMTQEGREWAKRTGAVAESTIMQTMGELSSANHSIFMKEFQGVFSPLNIVNQPTKFLKTIMMTDVDNLQRVFAANMGKALVEDIIETNSGLQAKRIARGLSAAEEKIIKKGNDTLLELGINPQGDLSKIAIHDLERAAQRFSNEVNFISSPDQMPIALQNPYLRPFLQFKSFVIKHTAFVNKNVVEPAKKGNFGPALTYLATGLPAGYAVDEIRRFLLGDDKDYTLLQRIIRALTAVGGLGIMTDVAGNVAYDEAGLQKWAMGPAASDIAEGGYALAKTIIDDKHDPRHLQRYATGLIPFPQRNKVRDSLKKKSTNPYGFYNDLYKGTYEGIYKGF